MGGRRGGEGAAAAWVDGWRGEEGAVRTDAVPVRAGGLWTEEAVWSGRVMGDSGTSQRM
jgi:hypothetical protein